MFHNSFNYKYHFIIKELAERFEGQFECLGENTKNYIIFIVPIKRENVNGKTIRYKIKFIDGARFMAGFLSSLVDALTKVLHKDKCKDCKSELKYVAAKRNILTFKCVDSIKNYEKEFDEDLAKRFENTYRSFD